MIINTLTKYCSRCHKNKSVSDFRLSKRNSDGYCVWCKSCEKEYKTLWRIGNQEEINNKKRQWRKNNLAREQSKESQYRKSRPEKEKEKRRKYVQSHLDKVYGRIRQWQKDNHDRLIEIQRNWRLANPDKVVVQVENRRSRKVSNGGVITSVEWRKLKEKYKYTCLCCKRREPEIKLTLDHIKPLAKGGTNTIDNVQPLCGSCNSSKNTKEVDYR